MKKSNIILLLNKKISNSPLLLFCDFDLIYYNSNDKEYYLDIVEKINNNINNYKLINEWKILFNNY